MASYSEWLTARLDANEVYVRNNSNTVSHIGFNTRNIDYMVLRTKNPQALFPLLSENGRLRNYRHYIEFTLNLYNTDMEPMASDKQHMANLFKMLSGKTDGNIIWKYAPIVFTSDYNVDWHIRSFRSLANMLSGYTRSCVIEFAILSDTARSKLKLTSEPNCYSSFIDFCKKLQDIAENSHITLYNATKNYNIEYHTGIKPETELAKSINKTFTGRREPFPEIIDIGKHNTCTNNCLICDKNSSDYKLTESTRLYDPQSPILCDTIRSDDKIIDKILT